MNVKFSPFFHQTTDEGRKAIRNKSDLFLDISLPSSVRDSLPSDISYHVTDTQELTHISWQGFNCRPTEFTSKDKHELRPNRYIKLRDISLLVSIRITEKDDVDTIRDTLYAVLRNINRVNVEWDFRPLLSWKNILVVFIGSTKFMQPKTKEFLRRINLICDIELSDGTDWWQRHLYEVTAYLSPRPSTKTELRPARSPYQLMFLDSPTTSISADEGNIWIVKAFAALLDAKVWVSIEPGKKLVDTAFVSILWRSKRDKLWEDVVGYSNGIFRKSFAADPAKSFRVFHKTNPEGGQDKPLPVSLALNLGNAVRAYRLSHLLSPNYKWLEP